MPKRFKDQNACPPGGFFKYRDHIHSVLLKEPSWRRLLATLAKYYTANKWSMPSEQEIIDNVCGQQPGICFDSEAPAYWKQAVNVVSALGEWASKGLPVTPKETLDKRLSICQACNYWGGVSGGSLMQGKCGKCGCSGLKLAMATTKCPIGKW